MKKCILFLLACCVAQVAFSQKMQPADSIVAFVEFLKGGTFLSAKEYVLKSFEDKDIVVLSERHHAEFKQYELIIDILGDPRFKGNIYTEVGVMNTGKQINELLKKEGLKADEVDAEIRNIFKNLDMFSLWPNYNYYYLISSVYTINQGRKAAEKIFIYPLDLIFSWDSLECAGQYKMFMDMMEPQNNMPPVIDRNEIMAKHFISVYEDEKYSNPNKSKALVIMNTYHGYTRIPAYLPKPTEPRNYSTAEYIYKTYPQKTKGILINGYIFWPNRRPVAGGKWDAAFRLTGKKDMGFDIKGSPFGATTFDMYNFGGSDYKTVNFEFIFDGMVFYKPIEEFELQVGIPGLFNDPAFVQEYYRRVALEENMSPEQAKTSSAVNEDIKKFNVLNTSGIKEIDQIRPMIDRWIINK